MDDVLTHHISLVTREKIANPYKVSPHMKDVGVFAEVLISYGARRVLDAK